MNRHHVMDESCKQPLLSSTSENNTMSVEPVSLSNNGKCKKENDVRNHIIIEYLPIIKKCTYAYYSPYLTREDLLGYGVLGLIRAIELYNPSMHKSFYAYATLRIREALQHAIISANRFIRLPRSRRQAIKKWRKGIRILEQKLERSPTYEEIKAVLNGDNIEVMEMQRALSLSYVSVVDTDILKNIPFRKTQTVSNNKDIGNSKICMELLSNISQLPYLQRTVLELRYGLESDNHRIFSLKEISCYLGISKCKIRRLERKAISRLRFSIENRLEYSKKQYKNNMPSELL